METKEIIFELRMKNKLSQDELAEKVCVTRQAVSRWGNRGNHTKYRNIEITIQVIRCFHQYSLGFSKTLDLPMLWHAAR